jgi:hypothetical protein
MLPPSSGHRSANKRAELQDRGSITTKGRNVLFTNIQFVQFPLKLVLVIYPAIKAYWEWRYSSKHYLTSALYGSGQLQAPTDLPQEKPPGTHRIVGWVGLTNRI